MVLYAGRLVYLGTKPAGAGKACDNQFGLCSHSTSSVILRGKAPDLYWLHVKNIGGFHHARNAFLTFIFENIQRQGVRCGVRAAGS